MSQALNELSLRLDELRNDLTLLEYTFELRPRIMQVLDFEKRGEALDLARRFGAVTGNIPATFYGPMLVRLVAAFERYLRSLMREIVETWVKKAKTFDELSEGLSQRNLILSGRFIANSAQPREHLNIDLVALVDNLVTCRAGSTKFELNSYAFMTLITGVTPDVIESSLEAAQISSWWNAVGADKTLQERLSSTRTVDTKKMAADKLKELSRWRNNWAHGGDDEVSLTNAELVEALGFLSAFSRALDAAVAKQLK